MNINLENMEMRGPVSIHLITTHFEIIIVVLVPPTSRCASWRKTEQLDVFTLKLQQIYPCIRNRIGVIYVTLNDCINRVYFRAMPYRQRIRLLGKSASHFVDFWNALYNQRLMSQSTSCKTTQQYCTLVSRRQLGPNHVCMIVSRRRDTITSVWYYVSHRCDT